MLFGFALALLLLATLVYVLTPPIDQRTVRATYSGSLLKLENRKGQTIEEIEVGTGIVHAIQSQNRSRSHALLSLGPSPDAGVVWAASSTDQGEVIRSRRMAADTLLWEKAVDVEVMFPKKPFANTSNYCVEVIYAADTRGACRRDLCKPYSFSVFSLGVCRNRRADRGFSAAVRPSRPPHIPDPKYGLR